RPSCATSSSPRSRFSDLVPWVAMTRIRPLGSRISLLAAAAIGAGGCTIFVQLPSTPRLRTLTEEQVFAMDPAPEWPQPQADNPATAAVDVACGVGPRTSNGFFYAAVSVRGRPPSAALAPLNVSLVLDRSGSMHGDPFRNMLLAAEAFVGQLR